MTKIFQAALQVGAKEPQPASGQLEPTGRIDAPTYSKNIVGRPVGAPVGVSGPIPTAVI